MSDIANMKLLVVDDEPALCELISFEFELKGASVVTAGNVDDAFEKYKATKPDLVITDIRMPGKDGIDLLKMIKAENLNTPVILMTGYADIEYMEAFELGADDIFTKPVDRKSLAAAATVLCNERVEWLNREIPTEIEQFIDVEIDDILDDTSGSKLIWGRAGFFLETEIPFPSLDTFIQINLKSKNSGEITELKGKVRFTRFDDVHGVGVQVYGIDGYKKPEITNFVSNLETVASIPKQNG
ncbi:response regulator [bacterium]|nr:response regulator [bacterium]